MVPSWPPPAHERPAALAGWKSTLGCPRVFPWCSPAAGTAGSTPAQAGIAPKAVSAATLPCFIASWHCGGGIFDKLGCNSQQLLYHPQEMGETWGRDAAWLSPGQTSATGRPWATHKCEELKKQTACCVRVFPLRVLCSRPGACLAVPCVLIREAVPLAAGFSG